MFALIDIVDKKIIMKGSRRESFPKQEVDKKNRVVVAAEWEEVDLEKWTVSGWEWVVENDRVFVKAIKSAAKHDPLAYQKLRVKEYPPLGDQLDAIMKALSAISKETTLPGETLRWIAKCKEIKQKYPKAD